VKALYWLIKCDGGYWLEEGGVDPKQSKGEKHFTRKKAREERSKWLHPGETAWLVRVVPKVDRG
jgi:hypothetical protein